MATFYQPPPPFVGGRQPLEGNRLQVPVADVPGPPFGRKLAGAAVAIAVGIWSTVAPQPVQARLLNPLLLDVAVNLPPGVGSPKIVSFDDAPLPQVGARLNPALLNVVAAADAPNPQRAGDITILQSWVVRDGLPQLQGKLPIVVTDVRVDDPPRRGPSIDPSAWLVPVALPQLPRQLSPAIPGQSVDTPPSRRVSVVYPIAPPDLPQLQGKLSPAIPGQSVDPPPPRRTSVIFPAVPADQPQQPRYNVPVQVVVADSPPKLSTAAVDAAVATWQPQSLLPQQPGKLPVVVTDVRVDNPPFSQRSALSGILVSWRGDAAIVPAQRFVPPQAVAVSFTPFSATWLNSVIASWQAGDVRPQQSSDLSPGIPGQSVDAPSSRRVSVVFPVAVPDQPQLPRLLSPGIPGQSVDRAPGLIPGAYAVWLDAVLKSWLPGPPQPQEARKLPVPVTDVRVDNPPPKRAPVDLAAWQAQAPQPQPLAKLPQVTVAAPVLDERAWLLGIIQSWMPAAPQPTLSGKLSPSITAVAVNNPPFSQRSALSGILSSWRDVAVVVPAQRFVPQSVAVTFTPFSPDWIDRVVASWQPSDVRPQQPRNLSPGIPGQSVDRPPPPRAPSVELWRSVDGPPQQQGKLSPGIPGQSIDRPPSRRLSVVYPTAAPDLPQLQGKLSPAIPGQSVDAPPPARAFTGDTSWRQAQPVIVLPRNIAPLIAVTFVPRGPQAWLVAVVASWNVTPDRVDAQPKLPPSILAVAVNDPPFSQRSVVPTVLLAWVPPAPLPTVRIPYNIVDGAKPVYSASIVIGAYSGTITITYFAGDVEISVPSGAVMIHEV